MRKINLLGLQLSDVTLSESVDQMRVFLKNGAMNTVLYLNTKLLVAASRDEQLSDWIESADMVICGEKELLGQIGITSKSRLHEAETFEHLKYFLEMLKSSGSSLYLVADTGSALKALEKDIEALCPEIAISGMNLFGDDGNLNSITINEINGIVPTMIIMRMPYAYEKRLIGDGALINSEAVIGLPEDLNIAASHEGIYEKLIRKVYIKVFKSRISEYSKKENK